MPDNVDPQNQGTPGGNGGDGGATPAADRTVPLAELLKERRERQALEARLRELEQKDLSETERLRKRAQELEALEPELRDLRAMVEAQRDDILKGMPKERRDAASTALEGLPLAKQIAVLRTFAIQPEKPAPSNPAVDRRSPAPPTDPRAPRTYTEWERLPKAQRDEWRKRLNVDELPLE